MAIEDQPRSKRKLTFEDEKFWFVKKAGVITVGFTVMGLEEIGTAKSVTLPNEGDDVDKNEVVAEVKGSDGTLEIYTPAAGFVVEANTALENDPELINEDPDGEGWLVRIEIQDDADLKEYEETE